MTTEPRKEVLADGIEIWLGDCRDVLPLLGRVDAVVTDPPYGIGADKNKRAGKQHGRAAAPSTDYGMGDWDSAPPDQTLLESIAKVAGTSIFWGANFFHFPPSSCWLVWDKDNGNNGYADCELAWTNMPIAVRKIRFRWMGMLQENMAEKEERFHPTQKPTGVMRWCIDILPADAEIILDPFMGSGTTGVACVNLSRRFIGVEREPKYYDIARRRISEALSQPRLPLDKPIAPKQEALSL